MGFHEEVICSIRLHYSGRLTVKPCASGDYCCYNHPTYVAQFTTPKGVMYEYSFECLTAPLNNTRVDMIKGSIMIKKNQQIDTISLQLRHRRLHLLVSASSTTDDVLSVGYNVVLPDQIYCEASSSRLNGNTAFTSSISSISEGNGARRRNESFIKNLCASLLVVVSTNASFLYCQTGVDLIWSIILFGSMLCMFRCSLEWHKRYGTTYLF